jgi:hypothetical protein
VPEYLDGGNVGYLTADQYTRFQWAVHDSRKLVPWLRVAGYIRAGDVDELKHRSNDRPLGLPPTWLAAEEISRLLLELNKWATDEDAAIDVDGSDVMLLLTREVETAAHKWPFEDKPHNVTYMRCQVCQQTSLRWHPPRHEGDGSIVRCRDRSCGAVMDESMFRFAAEYIRAENEERERRARERKRARRLGDRKAGAGDGGEVEGDDLPVGGGWADRDDASDEGVVA